MFGISAPPEVQAQLPSRVAVETSARTHWNAGNPLAVFGKTGSGRTTFANRLLSGWSGRLHRFTGVQLLRDVQFSALAGLLAQARDEASNEFSAVQLIAMFAAETSVGTPLALVLDDADFIDDSSAAAIAQAVMAGGLQILMIGTTPARLPAPLRSLALDFAQETLEPLTTKDAVVMAEEILAAPVTLLDADRLREMAGRNARYLRELVIDARDSGGITVGHGFAKLREGWIPNGRRIGELIAIRLSQQPPPIREAVALLAITGEIPMQLAQKIVSADVLERGLEAGLLEATATAAVSGTGKRRLVRVSGGLTPETVLAHVSERDLRRYAEHALKFASDMNPESRIIVGLHATSAGVELPERERETLAAEGLRARLFSTVLVLTDPSDGLPLSDTLKLARSRALFEAQLIDPAFEILEPLLEKEDFDARVWAATMSGSLGRLAELNHFLTAADGDSKEQSAELKARGDIQRFRAGEVVPEARFLSYVMSPGLPGEVRADARQSALMARVLGGKPRSAMTEISAMMVTPEWQTTPPGEQGELLMVLFQAAIAAAEMPSVLAAMGDAEWGITKTLPALFIGAEGLVTLEAGDAHAALKFLKQAVVVADSDDRVGISSYFASGAALAASTTGDVEAAAEFSGIAEAAQGLGGPMRAESARLRLFTHLQIEGRDGVIARWQELRDRAQADR